MLARTIAWICGWGLMWAGVCDGGEKLQPNVLVMLAGDGPGAGGYQKAMEILDADVLRQGDLSTGWGWRRSRGTCRVNVGSSVLSALLYGKQPLADGVVSDRDWRRIPIVDDHHPSLAEVLRQAGYHTAFYGGWKMGKTVPYDPKSRGFGDVYDLVGSTATDKWGQVGVSDQSVKIVFEAVAKAIRGEKAVFGVMSPAAGLAPDRLVALLKSQILSGTKKIQRPTIILMMSVPESDAAGGSGGAGAEVDDQGRKFHQAMDWVCYHYGNKSGHLAVESAMKVGQTDWEMNFALKKVLLEEGDDKRGDDKGPNIAYRFFHKERWPAQESPDKYRHRGSLVVGKGYALVDGLELYPVHKNLVPDFTRPLDIATNQKLHSELLLAHAQWWKQARKALHDPRAFAVGVEDKQPIRLTMTDWRPSKIVHPDGTSPAFKPLASQKELLSTLKEMENDDYRQSFPAYSGSWAVDVKRPGRYKITASMLPKEATKPGEKRLAKLRGGRAFVRLGRNKVELDIIKGASAVSVLVDADEGVTDLECWFTGQLALERELGAFFVEIERVGDKKFDLKAKE